MRDHLERAAATDPSAARELIGPPLPPVAAIAWRTFDALHRARPVSANGIVPISYTELSAFVQLTDSHLTPLDIALVRVIDEVYVEETAAAMTSDRSSTDRE